MALLASLPAFFLAWASRLRFPTLLLVTGAIFVLDVFIPDAIPFVDELLLGLATVMLASWRRRDTNDEPPGS